MTKTPGKAAWAARRARELEEQARALLDTPAADWRARQRLRDGAARLRAEVAEKIRNRPVHNGSGGWSRPGEK